MTNAFVRTAAGLGLLLGAALVMPATATASTIILEDDFNDGTIPEWSITAGSKGSTVITATTGVLETYFDAPASIGAGFAGATRGFTLTGAATSVRLALDGRTAGCQGCTMRYQALIDGVLVIDGTNTTFLHRDVAVADLAIGHHELTLRHSTNAASSGHFTAFFDNVQLTGDVAPAPVPVPAGLVLMPGALALLARRKVGRAVRV